MHTKTIIRIIIAIWLAIGMFPNAITASEHGYFKIHVVDKETGRGVPMVELKTVNEICYYTDSNGIVAFYEPGLMNREVFFHIRSHGYSYPKDGFGYEGTRLTPIPGQEAVIKIKRLNIAERLYRITGQGIYRDSVLLGMKVPLQNPVLNGQVVGQDSTLAVSYRGKVYWFWGDTSRPSYPLGNFRTSGATSELPQNGGLSPGVGIDLHYFVDDKGFCKSMCPIRPSGLIWIDGLIVLPDTSGQERMLAHYSHRKSLGEEFGHGLVMFDDEKQEFLELTEFNIDKQWQAPRAHPVIASVDGIEYAYFPTPFPNVRVRKTLDAIKDQDVYEAFTCLHEGTKYRKGQSQLDRQDGKPVYAWKRHTDPIGPRQEKELIEAGLLKKEDAHFLPSDIDSDASPIMHSGSIRWNGYRNKWIMIAVEIGGSSMLGEVWYSESDTLEGPWTSAQKIVTHDQYTFYNPVQHSFFDQQNGRIVYFEGTYSKTFSGNDRATPWYDYNQIMYRLDLSKLSLNINR